ncbi:MAG: thiamine pyrophosphate-binding protein [Caulobacteraceae bacterium]
MAEDQARADVGRRGFLKGAALGGVAAVANPVLASAQDKPKPAAAPGQPRAAGPIPPSQEFTQRDENAIYTSCGGDYMTDVLRSLGIEYFAATPGNTFMGLHEAIVNYGMLTAPKIRSICTMHEEASVAMAHGYAKIEGKPMAAMFHTTVGTQHASMAIYNAYCDRVPIFMMTGCALVAERRPGAVDWHHDATDGPALVRDFTKWDDTPASLTHFGESAVRAWKFAMTPPNGPVLLAVDTQMQEDEIPGGAARRPPIPKLPSIRPPSGDANTVREVAKMLVAAEHPLIYADRAARTPEGLKMLVDLAETLGAPVCDSGNRMNFPWRHPLNQSRRQAVLANQADMLLALEPGDPFGLVTRKDREGNLRPALKAGAKSVTISSVELYPKGNYQDLQRYAGDVDIAVEADAEATLPYLIEEVKRLMPASRSAYDARAQGLAKAHLDEVARSKQAAVFGWDDTPGLHAPVWRWRCTR